MGYIGRAAAVGQTETVKDSFNGDNSTVAFTMSQSVSLDTDIEVFVGNVQQEPGSGKAYTVSGTTLTFSEAPPTGTGNIYVIHRNSLQGTLLPPQNLGDRNYLIGGNLSLDKDSAVLNFGADSSFNNRRTKANNPDGNGHGDFFYSPPSGYLCLCAANLTEPTISPLNGDQPSDRFNTVLYSGNDSTNAITCTTSCG